MKHERRYPSLLMILVLLLAAPLSWAGQRQALVIGNGAYADARLKNPANDARDIAVKLRSLGFTVTELIDADQRKMETAVRDFSRALGQDGVGLFYFAGHGIEMGGENYLLPVGADIQSEMDVKYKAISAGYVLDGMRAAGNPMNLVILDACRNNPYARSFRSGGSRGLTRMNPAKGSLVLYATLPGDVAEDGKGRNGLFTEKLLASLDQPGLKVEEVFKQTALAVDQASGQKQTPWQEGVILGDFYFREPTAIPPPPPRKLPPTPPSSN
ncbi:MAG: caspase family protein [Gammaproteobacteria bacterium]|nr:caspase family protein [Gammaproteobacteria bacterium]